MNNKQKKTTVDNSTKIYIVKVWHKPNDAAKRKADKTKTVTPTTTTTTINPTTINPTTINPTTISPTTTTPDTVTTAINNTSILTGKKSKKNSRRSSTENGAIYIKTNWLESGIDFLLRYSLNDKSYKGHFSGAQILERSTQLGIPFEIYFNKCHALLTTTDPDLLNKFDFEIDDRRKLLKVSKRNAKWTKWHKLAKIVVGKVGRSYKSLQLNYAEKFMVVKLHDIPNTNEILDSALIKIEKMKQMQEYTTLHERAVKESTEGVIKILCERQTVLVNLLHNFSRTLKQKNSEILALEYYLGQLSSDVDIRDSSLPTTSSLSESSIESDDGREDSVIIINHQGEDANNLISFVTTDNDDDDNDDEDIDDSNDDTQYYDYNDANEANVDENNYNYIDIRYVDDATYDNDNDNEDIVYYNDNDDNNDDDNNDSVYENDDDNDGDVYDNDVYNNDNDVYENDNDVYVNDNVVYNNDIYVNDVYNNDNVVFNNDNVVYNNDNDVYNNDSDVFNNDNDVYDNEDDDVGNNDDNDTYENEIDLELEETFSDADVEMDIIWV